MKKSAFNSHFYWGC